MKKSRLLGAVCASILSVNTIQAFAAIQPPPTPVPGQGTWETTLKARDFDGDTSTVEGWYDTVLDVTWLASGSNQNGMTWVDANAWADSLDYGSGIDNWRLPIVVDTGASGCDLSTVGGTDCGLNVQTTSGSPPYPAENVFSEMASLFYDTLGNLSWDVELYGFDNMPEGHGLTNTGPFDFLSVGIHWTGSEVIDTNHAWYFVFYDGAQNTYNKGFDSYFSLPVHDGDVGSPIPEITTVIIDIKPNWKNNENEIDLKRDKSLKVAILFDGNFDPVSQVDPTTVLFGPSPASTSRYQVKDADKDGDVDLILIFKTKDTGIECGHTAATLTGQTYGGDDITGSDTFTVVPCP